MYEVLFFLEAFKNGDALSVDEYSNDSNVNSFLGELPLEHFATC